MTSGRVDHLTAWNAIAAATDEQAQVHSFDGFLNRYHANAYKRCRGGANKYHSHRRSRWQHGAWRARRMNHYLKQGLTFDEADRRTRADILDKPDPGIEKARKELCEQGILKGDRCK